MSNRNRRNREPGHPIIGVLTIELHFPEASSLKTKRMVLKSLQERLRRRFNVAVAEIGYQDLWQRAALAAVSVASGRAALESHLEAIERELETHFASELVATELEVIG